MSHLGVIAFDDTTRAGVVRETLADAKSEGYLWLDGPLVVIEDKVGSVHIDQVMNSGVKVGVRGSWLGLRVGFL